LKKLTTTAENLREPTSGLIPTVQFGRCNDLNALKHDIISVILNLINNIINLWIIKQRRITGLFNMHILQAG